jgi:hypothetical protein
MQKKSPPNFFLFFFMLYAGYQAYRAYPETSWRFYLSITSGLIFLTMFLVLWFRKPGQTL